MIKICYVLSNLNIGGSEKLTIEVANLLDKKIFEVTIICLFDSNQSGLKHIINSDIPLINLDLFNHRIFSKVQILKRELKKYDIIHSCSEDAHIYCAMVSMFNIWGNKKFVMTIHGVESVFIKDEHLKKVIKTWTFKYYFLIRYFLTLGFQFYTSFISVCNYTKIQFSENRNISKSKIVTIYHGIINSKFENRENSEIIRTKLGYKSSDIVLGYVGRLAYAKGIEDLLTVFKTLALNNPNLKLVFVGDGDLREYIENFISINNLNQKCVITGFVSDVNSYYKGIDIFVLPSKSESTSMVTQEAMLNGVLCLCSNIGGIDEIIENGVNGILFNNSDIKDFEEKLYYCIENRDNLDEMKKNAIETIKSKFDLTKNIIKISEFLKSL
jgi:glycosyltransferase involved in cell wall biosynthesis